MKITVAAIDFGTSKIVTLVAENGGNQRCDIIGAGVESYDGYQGGAWISPESLKDAIAGSVAKAQDQSRHRIREINVGVPGEFSRVYAVESKVELQGTDPRVTPRDIELLFARASEELSPLRGVIVHRSPAWFIVDDGKKTLEPVGMKGRELRALVSFVVADEYFLSEVRQRMDELGIKVNGYFSVPTGEAMLYLPDEERDRTAVLIDMGYLTTDVMAVEGDAVVFHESIPMGGAYIALDVTYGLDIPLPMAEEIKRNYVYGLSGSNSEIEAVSAEGRNVSFPREKVAEVLEPRVDEIAEAVKKSIDESGVKLGNWSSVYLTGGGIAINRGGKDYLAAKLERPVREVPKRTAKLNSPVFSSALGLMDLVIDTMENQSSASGGPFGGIADFFRSLFGN
jgi:cell division protein FtsA